MRKFKDLTYCLRMITGVTIMAHGLIRIVQINDYINFVLDSFSGSGFTETLLILGSALFPFLEFFTGLLFIYNLALRRAVATGFFISLIMSAFIIAGNMYPRLVYHSFVFVLLLLVHQRVIKNNNRKITG